MSTSGKEGVEKTVETARGLLTNRFSRPLDPKKRLTIPSVWRHALGSEYVYVMRNPNAPCLDLIPKDLMEARVEAVKNLPLSNVEVSMQLEVIGENSELLEFDSQGRIRISDRFLAYADLKDVVVMKGSLRIAKLWAPENAPPETTKADVEKLRNAMAALGF